jgi:electron transport complex protein RnfD
VLHLIDSSYPDPLFMLFSGGLMLGAVYMATDMVTSPVTNAGRWVFGAGIGVLVVVIRIWGGLPEGVMYAILLMNATVPFIDRWTQPRVFGTGKAVSG